MMTIYLLRDPRTDKPRYVGITSKPVSQRLQEHFRIARNGKRRPICFWLRKLDALDLRPIIQILEVTVDAEREEHWISAYREQHPRSMLNLARGAGGVGPRSAAARRKASLAMRGEKGPSAKLTDAKVAEMRRKFREGGTMRSLAKAFGICGASAARAIRGVDWSHVPDPVSRDEVSYAACHLRADRTNHARGARSGKTRLTDDIVMEMRTLAADGWAHTRIAKRFGISPENVRAIIVGRTWTHLQGAISWEGKWASADHAVTKARGTRHARAQLTDQKVFEARLRYANGERINKIAREYGITAQGLGEAVGGKTWKHVPMPTSAAA